MGSVLVEPLKRPEEKQMAETIKGKELKVGMNVICLDAPKKSPLAPMSGVPLTVKAVELPFVVFTSECQVPSVGFVMFGQSPDFSTRPISTTVNIKRHKFREVSASYVNAIRRNAVTSDEFPDLITDSQSNEASQ